jgi:subtilisin
MKAITTLLIVCACSFPVVAQDVPFFPAKLDHNGVTVQFYPSIVYLVVHEKTDSITLANMVSESKMSFSELVDTVVYTANGKNRWLRKMNGDSFTIGELSTLQTKLGNKVMVSPAYYTPNKSGDQRVFAPLPNVLVIDKNFVTDEVVHYLKQQFKVVINEKRTQEQIALTIFDVPLKRVTVFEIQEKLISEFSQLHKHVRFENQPLVSHRLARMSMSQAITAQGPINQWNLDIIKSDAGQFTNTTAVKVGLIEMGCDVTHASLNLGDGTTLGVAGGTGGSSNQLHGTMMAGIIGARSSSSLAIRGVTPFIQIVPVARTAETDVEVAEAISYCINHGVNVINMSFGRDASGELVGGPTWDFRNIDSTLTVAHDHNIVLVAAAGNGFSRSGFDYPAKHPNVMAVGASNKLDKLFTRSNHGDLEYLGKTVGISVVAPGAEMYVTVPGGSMNERETGTSGATAHVTALAALLKSRKPSLSADSIRYIIEHTADKIDDGVSYGKMAGFANGTRNVQYGYGRINVEKALALITPAPAVVVTTLKDQVEQENDKDNDQDTTPKEFPWLLIILILLVVTIIVIVVVRKNKNKNSTK